MKVRLKATVAVAAILAQLAAQIGPAAAFCGFYVAKADARLFNKSSKVVLTRDGATTAITMASDYEGSPKEFALVIPVPTFIERRQIGVVDMKTVDHLDAYTAPRLVEYHDPDPCALPMMSFSGGGWRGPVLAAAPAVDQVRYRGVTVEANYDVGEYDVSILSAKESDGLTNWLTDNGYKTPDGAGPVLGSYIRQNMRFFVAKVNLERMALLGGNYLRPLQVRYDTPKFMLPLRLGTVNANGPQDLIIYALTKNGRVEAGNYRTVKIPTDIDVPLIAKSDFGNVYKAMFDEAVRKENMRAVFVEYAWDMAKCDPCAADPLSSKELIALGARWISDEGDKPFRGFQPQGTEAFVTRLHVRYDAQTFPEDLVFIETKDRSNFQGRYVLRHPWTGTSVCAAEAKYRKSLPARFKQEAANLARLTGWKQSEIEMRMEVAGQRVKGGK